MTTAARLITQRLPGRPDAAVLVLHGGAARRGRPTTVSSAQLPVLRMIPIASRIARAGHGRLAVFRLLNTARGWDSRHTPVDDVRWALDRIRERLGQPLPAGLVGHSLGGRAALLAAGHPDVTTTVALNPWLDRGDRVDLPARRVLIVHGSADRVADPARSAALARALSGTAQVGYALVNGGTHAMLRRRGTFERLAADYLAGSLLDTPTVGAAGRILAGASCVIT